MTQFGSMADIMDKIIEDDSDRQSGLIRFLARCGACGEVWRSKPARFSMADVTAENENKRIVYEAVWQREWDIAKSRAVEEAVGYFNLCPICKRTSCEKCFRVCDNIDMCAPCAERLGERGEPVGRI